MCSDPVFGPGGSCAVRPGVPTWCSDLVFRPGVGPVKFPFLVRSRILEFRIRILGFWNLDFRVLEFRVLEFRGFRF